MYNRVHVLGCPGSGKTTMAYALGERLALSVVDLDDVYWGSGWKQPDPDDFRARVKEVASQQKFVISGNYSSAWDVRIKPLDLAIMLDLPRLEAVRRILWRSFKTRFGGRIDMLPEACRAGPDHEPLRDYPAFIKFTWDCAGRRQPRLDRLKELGLDSMVYLSGSDQIGAFLSDLQRRGEAAIKDRNGPLPTIA